MQSIDSTTNDDESKTISYYVNRQMVDAKSAFLDVPRFVLGADVHANVRALRVALGSVVTELSQAKLAALVAARHSSRKVTQPLVQRWKEGVEPDYESLKILAGLAGVSFEAFALGDPALRKGAAPEPRRYPPPQPIDPALVKPVPKPDKGKGHRRAGGA